MHIAISILQAVAIFAVPALILRHRTGRLCRLFGPVGMAYFWGIAVALLVWLLNLCGLSVSLNADIGEIGSYVAVGVAIPLLLFGCSLSQIRRLTRPVLLSFGALMLAVLAVTATVYYAAARGTEWGRYICSMAVGRYTGGTPNFISIGLSTGADFSLIAVGNLSDMVIGGVFYVFLLLLARPLFARFLGEGREASAYLKDEGETEHADELVFRLERPLIRNVLVALGCAVLGAGVGVVIWLAKGSVDGTLTAYLVPGVMITVTVLGIALSHLPAIHGVRENAAAGQYLILVFSFALASALDLTQVRGEFLGVLLALGGITALTFLVHLVLCKLLGIGIDCALVTLCAGVYGPAFVPALTRQLDKPQLTAPGLICGSLGYAVGTFLGLGMFLILV